MSNNRAIAQLKKAAETLGQLAETLRNVSASMEPTAEKKTTVSAPKKVAEVTAEKKPGRQAAPDVKFKMLKRHLGTDHGLTPADYRARWNLPADYPMVAPNYAAARSALAKTKGLGRKPKETARKGR